MQDQEKIERWDGIVADWLAECDALDPEVVSVRKVIRPAAMVISSDSKSRQTHQIRLTQAGYRTMTTRSLIAAIELLNGTNWALVVIDSSLVSIADSELVTSLSKQADKLQLQDMDCVLA